MESNDQCGQSVVSLKRKSPEIGDHLLFNNIISLDDLNEDLFERILSWLPTSTFFRLNSVCKRWKSVASSASFKLACSHIPSRDPWFLMVAPNLNQSVIFDSAESTWKRLNHPPLLQEESNQNCMPVAASGGLICYRKLCGNFIVSNPVSGSCRELPPLQLAPQHQPLNAIVMSTTSKDQLSFKIVLVFGELPNLLFKVYNSNSECWEDETALRRKVEENSMEYDYDSPDENVVYFLSKAGILVASNMQRSPSKQYSSVITNNDGEEIVYFLSSSGNVVACNLTCKCFFEYPRLLPVFSEYSIDVVECQGEMLVVLLSEFLETATLRVWKYDEANRGWHQVAAMPAANSHEWYGKKADINCVGAGNQIFICLSSTELCTYILCDLETNKWVELPKCCINGEDIDFMSAFSFEPRIEASV
ncbi:F-box only protein 13 [Cajanus cajan]|uniref:F-box only protein 13 n=1 Tax=Cajanus cajan TaxID=3821 RepID=A0A151TTC8_CAJCA|nr:F-box only protein 13 [Cajanus cajan]KYP70305.1 F-box only protein 13 [Cajanus cajan]